jgi:hypothetical protein
MNVGAGQIACRPATEPGALIGMGDGAQEEEQRQGVQGFAFHK